MRGLTEIWAAYSLFACVTLLLLPFSYRRQTLSHSSVEDIARILLLGSAFTFITVAAGLRSLSAGFDTPSYVRAYQALDGIESAQAVGEKTFGNSEILFWPVQAILKSAGVSPELWLVLIAVATFCAMVLSYRSLAKDSSLDGSIAVLVLCTYQTVMIGNAIRQMLALPFAVLACSAYSDKKIARAFGLLLFAIGMHWSALIFALCPVFMLRWSNSRMKVLSFLALTFVLSGVATGPLFIGLFSFIDPVQSKIDLYTSSESHISAVYLTTNFWICITTAVAFVWNLHLFERSPALRATFLLSLAIVVFGIPITDIAERYMAQLLYFVPLISALVMANITQKVGDKHKICMSALTLVFITMGAFVLMQPSTRTTLGF